MLRLGGDGAIIPVKVKDIIVIPPAASIIEYVDFTSAATRSRYFDTDDFRNKVDLIAKQIRALAETLRANAAATDCGKFTYPTVSAFPIRMAAPTPPPLW